MCVDWMDLFVVSICECYDVIEYAACCSLSLFARTEDRIEGVQECVVDQVGKHVTCYSSLSLLFV